VTRTTATHSRLMRWVVQWVLQLSLACAASASLASPFVSYDFSSNDAEEPISGTLFFSAGMPVIDRCCSWVTYQPSAVVYLKMGNQTWTNAATPNGACFVGFHYGWIQVVFWCEGDPNLGDTSYRIDFWTDDGSNFSYDPDPTGPFGPDTLADQPVRGRLLQVGGPDNIWTLRSLSLDAVRITPYISEPSVPALLVAGAFAGLLTRLRRWMDKSL
jgi:hypothetical protein